MVDPDVPALLPHSCNPEVVFAAESGLSAATVLYIKTLSFFYPKHRRQNKTLSDRQCFETHPKYK